MRPHQLCVFGEVLIDIFPEGKRVLGGAPFNLAWHLQAFGQHPHLISRLGEDAAGLEIREAMAAWGMGTEGLQKDADHPTGYVEVSVRDGEPRYHIGSECAYDYIAAEALDGSACRLLYHGSLALRNPRSADTLSRLKAKGVETVFMDVNLRPPWWRREAVLALIKDADWVKMNQAELQEFHDGRGNFRQEASDFRKQYGLKGLIITRGHEGALVVSEALPPIEVKPSTSPRQVVDTVGAGDAFASVFVLGLVHAWPLEQTMMRAQAFASTLVSRQGAIVREKEFYQSFIDDWGLLR